MQRYTRQEWCEPYKSHTKNSDMIFYAEILFSSTANCERKFRVIRERYAMYFDWKSMNLCRQWSLVQCHLVYHAKEQFDLSMKAQNQVNRTSINTPNRVPRVHVSLRLKRASEQFNSSRAQIGLKETLNLKIQLAQRPFHHFFVHLDDILEIPSL